MNRPISSHSRSPGDEQRYDECQKPYRSGQKESLNVGKAECVDDSWEEVLEGLTKKGDVLK